MIWMLVDRVTTPHPSVQCPLPKKGPLRFQSGLAIGLWDDHFKTHSPIRCVKWFKLKQGTLSNSSMVEFLDLQLRPLKTELFRNIKGT